MAKVTGPLLSIDASGKIGDSIVFTRWRGTKVVRQYVIPANPNTAAQQVQRNFMALAINSWVVDLAPNVQQAWRDYMAGQPISGCNESVSRYIAAKVAAKTCAVASAATITPGVDQVTVAWTTLIAVKGRVLYGTKHRVYSAQGVEGAAVTNHSIVLGSLVTGVPYFLFITTTSDETKYADGGEYVATPT